MPDKPKTQTTTTQQSSTKNPWAPTVNPLTGIVEKADALAGDVGNFTPQFSSQTMAGIQGLTDAANGGPTGGFQALDNVVGGTTGAGFNTGLGTLTNTASGGMLNGNQYLDPVIAKTIQDTTRAVNSQFTAGGRYGSGAHADEIARQVGNVDASMRMANYNTERTASTAVVCRGRGSPGSSISQA
jgi:hypothetical protein